MGVTGREAAGQGAVPLGLPSDFSWCMLQPNKPMERPKSWHCSNQLGLLIWGVSDTNKTVTDRQPWGGGGHRRQLYHARSLLCESWVKAVIQLLCWPSTSRPGRSWEACLPLSPFSTSRASDAKGWTWMWKDTLTESHPRGQFLQ